MDVPGALPGHGLDVIRLDVIMYLSTVSIRGQLDNGMQGALDVRDLFGSVIHEVPHDAPHHGLVADHQNIPLPLQFLEK